MENAVQVDILWRFMNPFLFILLLTCMVILIFISSISATAYVHDYDDRNKPDTGIHCTRGRCATNLQTGLKRCPTDNTPEPFDPITEACNFPYSCTNPRTPYPLGTNGETIRGTDCPAGVVCACTVAARCPLVYSAVFQVSDTDGRVIPIRNSMNIAIPFGYRIVCQVPAVLADIALGCSGTSREDLEKCIQGKKAIEACPYGTAALLMPSERTFLGKYTQLVACTEGEPCEGDKVLYYDPLSNKYLCLKHGETCSSIGIL